MLALAEASQVLPRLVPHCDEAEAGASLFPRPVSETVSVRSSPALRRPPESMDRLAHDARNVLTGLMLYSELLATPGVLNPEHGHYARELETITGTAAWLLEKMVEATAQDSARSAKRPATGHNISGGSTWPGIVAPSPVLPTPTSVPLTPVPVTDAAGELRRLQPLLASIAGPAVRLSLATMPCAGRTALTIEDFTRVLINLVRNAADAMHGGGHIGIAVQYCCADVQGGGDFESAVASDSNSTLNPNPRGVILSVSDDGPGIPEALRERIFDLGFSTRKESGDWPTPRRRGLGLNIVWNLVEAAGGAVRATASHTGGARFEIVLPFNKMVTSDTCPAPPTGVFSADSGEEGCIECQ